MKNHKHLRDIQGTQFFRDFETYAKSVKESLFRNDNERELDRESRKLELFEKLAKLELSREEWEEIKTRDYRPETSDQRQTGIWDKSLCAAHFAFYKNAENRDQAFLGNLLKLMAQPKALVFSPRSQVSSPALLVAGGFHTQGLARQFKEKGISYVIVQPQINQLPNSTNYRAQMQGEVSWKDYFEVEQGKVNLYKAFVRGARDKLLQKAGEAALTSSNSYNRSQGRGARDRLLGMSRESWVLRKQEDQKNHLRLIPQDSRLLLKSWRDQIIRDLADQNKLAKAREYTQFLDEIAHNSRPKTQDALRNSWSANIDRFITGLRNLESRGRLTEQNILKLLNPATIPTITTASFFPNSWMGAKKSEGKIVLSPRLERPPFGRMKPRTEVPSARSELRTTQSSQPFASRAEVRTKEGEAKGSPEPKEEKLYEVYKGKEKIKAYQGAISKKDFKKLNGVTIKGFQLNGSGQLSVGGRVWAMFRLYPGAPIEFDVEKGLITEVRILNKEKKEKVVETIPLARVYQKNPDGTFKLKDVFYGAIAPKKLSAFDQATIKGFQLSEWGGLFIGGRFWAVFKLYPGAPIEFEVEEGFIIEVRIFDQEKKEVIKALPFARVYRKNPDKTLHLKDVFYKKINPKKFSSFDQVTIKGLKLKEGGGLSVGGRVWAEFTLYPGAPIEVDVEKGLITEVRIFDQEKKEVIKTLPFARVYRKNPDGSLTLKDVFYDKIYPKKFSSFNQVTIEEFQLEEKKGGLFVGGRMWAEFTLYPGAPIEVDVEKGLVTEVRIFDQEKKEVIKTLPFARVYRKNPDGSLILKDVFYDRIYSKKFSALDQVTIKGFQLNGRGGLSVGGRVWARFMLYPGAWVDIHVDKGEVSWVKIVKDRKGNPVNSRTGTGFGQIDPQRKLFPKEAELKKVLAEAFLNAGISESGTEKIANTLMRLKKNSLLLLVQEGILSEGEAKAINEDLDTTKFDFPKLAQRMKEEIRLYEEKLKEIYKDEEEGKKQKLTKGFINRVLSTHLLPWQMIERLQRTYRLGKDLTLIYQALGHPNVEAWIRRVRGAQSARGTLDTTKHLARYDPFKMPLISGGDRQRLYERFQSLDRVLQTLTSQSENDIPSKLQLKEVQLILASLQNTHLQTTGSVIVDRLLGLRPLSSSSSTLPKVQFFDAEIPYHKISEFESKGDEAQETAVQLALNSPEALFIEGPPGTGKTKVIAEIIRQAVSQGKKVLLVSQMHQAVDNALVAVMNDPKIPALRLGNDSSGFRYGTEAIWAGNREMELNQGALGQFRNRLGTKSGRGYVLAGTDICIATDWAFKRLQDIDLVEDRFDLVIMDEASRETLPGALVPLRYLKAQGKAIFVGDLKQLPPFGLDLNRQRELASQGVPLIDIEHYNRSVFEWLLERPFGDRVLLSTNYRSHPLIAGIVSELFYEGDIHRRGWEDFDAETLSLRVIDVAGEEGEYYEELVGTSYQNRKSAEQDLKLVQLHQSRGVALEDITMITPYKPQQELLEQMLRQAYPQAQKLPVISTIDSYQGGENKAIIFDPVRSNRSRQMGFVKDIRRMNVALSRAQDNLAIVWDSRTFTGKASSSDSPEDQAARRLFSYLKEYYEREVETFFGEMGHGHDAESLLGKIEKWTV